MCTPEAADGGPAAWTLPPVWETRIEFLTSGYILALLWLLWAFWEAVKQWLEDLPLSLSAFQVKQK